jgi:RNA polymerase sigma factor (sigma-70 family)
MEYKDDMFYIGQVLYGNINAYTHIVNRHKDRTYNLALRICGNREDAEEIAQDAFLKAYRSLKNFKRKSSFSTWLFRIVYNTAISFLRTRKAGVLSLEEFPADATDFIGINSTEEEAMAEYRNSLVNFALRKINEEERALITLYYYEEQTIEEISGITAISKSNVKVKLFRARQKMTGIIEKIEKKNLIYHG